ncbi:CSC1-like protein [Citrus sinensis]|uniref:CSC1-like protein n=1 Tax=Citrus sinensis TaxID=2711 RepID=A0ACB8KFJ8_CITSI|nr:CSC1-like protein [Citrus sinensis]
MATLGDIGVSALINILSAFAFLLAFALLRIQPINDRIYFPKWYINGARSSPRRSRNFVGKFVNLEFKTYLTFLNWMPQALKMTESEIINHAGLDSAVFLRIYTLGLKIFVPMTIVALLVLIPVNVSSGTLFFLRKELVVSDIDKLSISNVRPKSIRFFVHIGLEYLFTIWICFMLYKEYDIVASMRLRFLASQARRAEQFTVVVRNVPHVSGQSLSETIDHFFQTNHPDHYLCHQAVYNANKFAKLVRKRERLRNWLDYNQLKFERHPEKKPTTKMGFLGLWGKKVDAIDYYKHQMKELERRMSVERQKILKDSKSILPVAFVSFKSRWGAAVCAQTQQCKNPTLWLTNWAPEPRDIYWRNLAIPFVSLTIRKFIISVSVFALVFFYMIPIAFVQSLANLEGLERVAPVLRPVIELIPRTIGVSIPMKATFFITYIMVDGWAGIASEILRLKPLVIFHLKNLFLVKTERDREKAMDPGSVDFPETIPSLQLYFLLGIVYAVITPILLPFMLVFFGLAYLVYRHQIINVYNQQYESAGAFWPHVHSRIIASLLLSQLLLLGLLSTKEAANSTPFLVVLPILTLAFHKYCKSRFEPAFRKYPIEEAMAKDRLDRTTEPEINLKAYLADAYLHPIFQSFEEEELVEVRVDKQQVRTASPITSELSSPSPSQHVDHPTSRPQNVYRPTSPQHHVYHPTSPPQHAYNPTYPSDYIFPPSSPSHYAYHYES